MGHLGEVEDQRHALGVLAQEQRDAALVESVLHPGDHVAQPDHVAVVVGHLDADRRLAGDRRDDPDARHRQGDRQVVGQADDLRDAQAGLELDLELGDDRPGVDLHDADLVAEIQRGPLQQHRPGVDLGLVLLDREGRGRLEQVHRRQLRTAEPGGAGGDAALGRIGIAVDDRRADRAIAGGVANGDDGGAGRRR